ncbi:uncharacterized protein LOC101453722 [Ceratitis capitata]|uniref:uncharacterized protein LOC101453722 n=1 Tax=Ceratitis capitata TaxID=7213 RepID=UPI00032A2CB3|nr:uncharacterized protein LOC101453722 [Ceratitis capitata]
METKLEIASNLRKILESFLDENFITNNNVYFEKLLVHLAAKDNAYILQAPFALDWVDRCINILFEDFSKLNPKVISFVFNIFGLLINNEWTIIEIRERRLVDKMLVVVKRESYRFNPSIKLGVIRLLHAISKYSIGLAYLRTINAWQFLIEYCNQDHTVYVVREARHLLYEMLYKFDVKTNDEKLVKEILKEILKPILENVYDSHKDTILINVDDYELQHKLSSSLSLFSFILQQTLDSEEKSNIAEYCKVEHDIEITLWKLTETSHDEHFMSKILSTLSSFFYARLVNEKWNGCQISPECFTDLCVSIFNEMKICISRNYCVTFLKVAEVNHKLWRKLGNRVPKDIYIQNELVRFENQLITFQILPLYMLLRTHEFTEEEIFEKYMTKIFEIVCEHTLRIGYAYRDSLFNNQPAMNADLSLKAIHGVMAMVDILEHDQAVLVFQACIYALKEFMMKLYPNAAMDDPDDSNPVAAEIPSFTIISEFSNTIHAILIAMQTLIKRFKITWKESIETICLVNCSLHILQADDLPVKVAVQSLKLLQLSLEHFLAPNMALLMDNLKGSSLLWMGPAILKRYHDPAWEVRDSTIELVISIADISRLKYPVFQKFLSEHWMCRYIYDMAKNDSEPYVRASALRCISHFISIDDIWEIDLCKQNVADHLFDVLYNEPEAIVRKEAMDVLCTMNLQRKIASRHKDIFYSTLAYCAVSDLHWEVKVGAIRCWKSVICNLLSDEGMIDGVFPPVTFSKEKRKIVQLNEKEINLRFTKMMNELSQQGCLGVILKCLSEDCDVAVILEAKAFLKRLVTELDKYNYIATITATDNVTPNTIHNNPTTSNNSNDINTTPDNLLNKNDSMLKSALNEAVKLEKNTDIVSGDAETAEFLDSDEIIESILDSKDFNLLADAYEQSMRNNIKGDTDESAASTQLRADNERRTIHPFYYRQFTNVSVSEFFATIKRPDFEEKICKQDEWFLCDENLASLVDDLLCLIKPESDSAAISADCY